MDILTVNAGSSSRKLHLFRDTTLIAEGLYEMRGKRPHLTVSGPGFSISEDCSCEIFDEAAAHFVRILNDREVIESLSSIRRVAHRVVHGGTAFRRTTKLTTGVMRRLRSLSDLAPLHNPPALSMIASTKKQLPRATHYAVFDTAFHRDLPFGQQQYALPKRGKKPEYQRFGFHGISVSSAARQLAQLHQGVIPDNVLVCHLGSGASITALKGGKSIATSMGYTPLAGIPMMTRPGDMDPGVVLDMVARSKQRTTSKAVDRTAQLLNKECGMKALCGTSDMRVLVEKAEQKGGKYAEALEYYIEHVVMTMGSYLTLLGGLDSIVFTGKIGMGSSQIRARILDKLAFLGVRYEPLLNMKNVPSLAIQSEASPEIWILDPKEEWQMMYEVL